jgi:hypothetical protein
MMCVVDSDCVLWRKRRTLMLLLKDDVEARGWQVRKDDDEVEAKGREDVVEEEPEEKADEVDGMEDADDVDVGDDDVEEEEDEAEEEERENPTVLRHRQFHREI